MLSCWGPRPIRAMGLGEGRVWPSKTGDHVLQCWTMRCPLEVRKNAVRVGVSWGRGFPATCLHSPLCLQPNRGVQGGREAVTEAAFGKGGRWAAGRGRKLPETDLHPSFPSHCPAPRRAPRRSEPQLEPRALEKPLAPNGNKAQRGACALKCHIKTSVTTRSRTALRGGPQNCLP